MVRYEMNSGLSMLLAGTFTTPRKHLTIEWIPAFRVKQPGSCLCAYE